MECCVRARLKIPPQTRSALTSFFRHACVEPASVTVLLQSEEFCPDAVEFLARGELPGAVHLQFLAKGEWA